MMCRLAALCAIGVMLVASPVAAQQDVMALVRADRWAEAAAAATQYPDPVAAKLVTFYRLLAPGAATAAEIAAFMAENPDWPAQAVLARRRDEALSGEGSAPVLRALCGQVAPAVTATMLRCIDFVTAAGERAEAARLAGRAWVGGIAEAAAEPGFLRDYGALLTREDQAQRFERLAWADAAAAARQVARLEPGARARAEARLALKRDDPAAARLLAELPEAQRGDPGLVYEQAAWLRRAGQDEAARDLWIAAGAAAERGVAAERLAAFWNERNIVARRRLRAGDAAGAYAVAAGFAAKGGEAPLDATFLAGFIALRALGDPVRAERHFRALAELSGAAITQGRAWYWIGRSAEARGAGDAARLAYAEAAKWPGTFYGQLAVLKGGGSTAARITASADPMADAGRAMDFAGRELARAAAYLVGWGETRRAQTFLLRLDDVAPDPIDRSLVARLALGFVMPETAVALARRAGRDGVALLGAGFPQPVTPPPTVEPALALAIIRQESSFDSGTISPAGARGLMQLMPATAAVVARKLGLGASVPALVLEPAYNMRLGTAYLGELLDQYEGAVALAVAAYNAGPKRVNEWLAGNGDPRAKERDGIDWIELIPFGETRNYVQRVIENAVVYRARRGEDRPHPLAPWLR